MTCPNFPAINTQGQMLMDEIVETWHPWMAPRNCSSIEPQRAQDIEVAMTLLKTHADFKRFSLPQACLCHK